METALLLDNFDLLMDSPNSTTKMRDLILQLAVQGKLVPQDPNDEPASVLLKKIAKEKAKLSKEKKIRNAKLASDNDMPEVNIELPKGWALAKVADLLVNASDDIVDGPFGSKLKASEYVETGIPIIRIQNIARNVFKKQGIQFILNDKAKELERHNFIAGDIVLNKLGEPAGKACIVPEELHKGIIVADIIRIRLDESLHDKQFIVHSFNAPIIAFQFAGLAKGVTRQRVNLSQVRALKIPIPPLAEQRRIVAKVDQLMQLCDQLDVCQEKASVKYTSLNDSALERLLSSETIEEFAENWQFLCNNFELIYNDPTHVNKLRQAILQLAVQGKLVPQDTSEEQASELLKKIAAEKERLIKEGKIKKQKPLPEIGEDEKPFDLPEGWAWTRLGFIATFENGDRSKRYPNERDLQLSGIPFFGAKDMFDGTLRFDRGLRFISETKFNELSNGKLIDKDFVILLRGTVGKMAMFQANAEFSTGFINAQMLIVRMLNKKTCNYFNLYSASDYFKSSVEIKTTGSAVKQMPANVVVNFLIPLPPLAEQHRIVTKVDELMQLCDELESNLIRSKKDSEELLQSILQEN